MFLYLVGKYVKGSNPDIVWDVVGVFDSEEKALSICEGNIDYFIGSIELNKAYINSSWDDFYYPAEEVVLN